MMGEVEKRGEWWREGEKKEGGKEGKRGGWKGSAV